LALKMFLLDKGVSHTGEISLEMLKKLELNM